MNTNDHYLVDVIGFNDVERSMLTSIFALAARRDPGFAQYEPGASERTPDIYLVDADNAAAFGEFRALHLVHQRVGQLARDLAGELLRGHRLDLALRLHARRIVAGNEQVGAARLAHRGKQLDKIVVRLLIGKACHRNSPLRHWSITRLPGLRGSEHNGPR